MPATTPPSGLTASINSSNTKGQQKTKKLSWLHFTWREKLTNGGSGLGNLIKRKDETLLGKSSWRSYGRGLGQPIARTSTRRYLGSSKPALFEITRKNLRGLATGFKGGLKTLVGTFMGGLKPEISEEIRLFRPRTLKEAISLARMRDEQLQRQKRLVRSPHFSRSPPPQIFNNCASPTGPIKKLSWEEMQRRRAQGLCFNCNDKFTAGHKCTKPQLLILEAEDEENIHEESAATTKLESETGEDTAMIHQRFPSLTLGDKGSFRGGGDDKSIRKSKWEAKPNNKYDEYAWAHASQ